MSRQVRVYKGQRYVDAYLYVLTSDDLSRVPDALVSRMGELSIALEFELTKERVLARVEGARVLDALEQQGFYLQLPPAFESESTLSG